VDKKSGHRLDQPKWKDAYNTTQNKTKKYIRRNNIIRIQVGTVQKQTGKEKNAFEMIACVK
jgi:hypothetical protein